MVSGPTGSCHSPDAYMIDEPTVMGIAMPLDRMVIYLDVGHVAYDALPNHCCGPGGYI